jgi:hypothetical protein
MKSEDDDDLRPVGTPSSVNDSFELHPMDADDVELTPAELPKTDYDLVVRPEGGSKLAPSSSSACLGSSTGSSPEVRVGLKTEPEVIKNASGSLVRNPSSRPNLMIRIEPA